ncbi:MAG: nucleotidyltransferase family protein [Lachnospiraceae bacterium]|nr:nucleotidyltransferase family protein [Lachnospiraceae bacterium]
MNRNSIKIAGVIAEFNPFHDGHAYLLKKAREVTGADFVVVAMSGNFVQRGTPAVMDKSLRVRAALSHGADAVFELPVRTATGSADYFAEGAVRLLTALGVTDLCFGCETDDLPALKRVADVLAEESEAFREALKRGLKDGLSYAAAVQRAAEEYHVLTSSELTSILSLPNNLLAISYLKALRKCGSSIRPNAILRRGAAYHSEDSVPVSKAFPSAASLRKMMADIQLSSGASMTKSNVEEKNPKKSNTAGADVTVCVSTSGEINSITKAAAEKNRRKSGTNFDEENSITMTTTDATAVFPSFFDALKPYLSDDLFSLYQPEFGEAFPVFPDDFSGLLGKSLLDLKPEESYFDCAPDLYRRIYNHRRDFISFDDFCQRIHTKQFSLASAQRGVLHCMLGLKAGSKDDLYAAYLPLLGFRRDAGALLKNLSESSPLPLLSKTCEGRNLPGQRAVRQWEEIMYSDALYRLVRCCRFGRSFPLPEQAQIIAAE